MPKLLLIAIAGFGAQLVDGALGMAYGATSTTLLLAAGIAPALASASVHLAELGTTAISGFSHWRFGNVQWRTVSLMTVPGAIGGFVGAVVLTSIPAEVAAPLMAAVLCAIGAYVLLRFGLRGGARRTGGGRRLPWFFLSPLGLFAGFMDAVGGGGWGPISTPALLSSGRIEPRHAIGSVDTAEFFVALGASAGFLISLGSAGIVGPWVLALLAGGVVAAPLAAWLVQRLPAAILGAGVGGLILITNVGTLAGAAGVPEAGLTAAYVFVGLVWLTAIVTSFVESRRRVATG
jgi:uncharacterized protein